MLDIQNFTKEVYTYSQDLNILYVEDDLNLNQETYEIFEDLFKYSQTAVDGVDGLNKYKEFYQQNGKFYDIVITDIQMPNLNGIELIKEIQNLNKSQEIIVVSAYNDSEKLMSLIELGINYFALKPISHQRILEVLYKVSVSIKNKGLEEKLKLQQSKNASLGLMIANIIHQWKQPLNIISVIASAIILKIDFDDDIKKDELRDFMSNIDNTVKRLTTVTHTFKEFLKEKKEVQTININKKIEDALIISDTILRDKGIDLIKDIQNDDITIKTIPNELTEVIINIVNNAADAIVENNIKNGFVKVNIEKTKSMVIISIEDNGGGVPEDIKEKIFDEYFTTKSEDKGTGLGLAMSKRIVTQSLNGKLYIENTQDGAKFIIELPLS